MYIEHITIENFGAILFYDADFTPELNLLDSRYASEISAALAFLLCNKKSPAIPEPWLRECTQISARIRLADAVYTVCAKPQLGRLRLCVADPSGADATARYQYALSHCPEQDAIEAFDGQDKTMPSRLCRYLDQADREGLSFQTQRLADTRTFRSHIFRYIHAFCPEPINCKKNYLTTINAQGKFEVFYPGISGAVFLSETEEKLFLYICFLNIAQFWADIEQTRDLHHEKKPLLIRNFLEFLDESADMRSLIARTQRLKRQIIILTTPLDRGSKRKWFGQCNGEFF